VSILELTTDALQLEIESANPNKKTAEKTVAVKNKALLVRLNIFLYQH